MTEIGHQRLAAMEAVPPRSYITDVTSTNTALVVKLGPDGHEGIITIRWGRSITNFPAWDDKVELHWSGTSRLDLDFAQEFAWALDEAVTLAKNMTMLAEGDDDYTASAAICAPDWMLAMLVMRKGYDVFYKRGRVLTGDENARVVDREHLRAIAVGAAVKE
jgi:hypothetical protein